ncbi:MAG: N-acetyltransferase [Proteobacteria bacterium]|nr:N-acetyltransferase [Pseudomonadota bacterium]NOG59453.1 N-acetyltransferase [Pseudomonadota bacterium]
MFDWRIVSDLQTISPEKWQDLDYSNNPFLSYPFLSGLEKFGCLENQHWQPSHIVIEKNNELLGVLPLYIKQDSYGEFVFDWAWADAYQQSGRDYYPKLVSAIPFTPVCGSRLLVNKNHDYKLIKKTLLNAAISLMNEKSYSSLHFLFSNEQDIDFLIDNNGLKRLTCQYHWFNHEYRDFQDFLDSLTSKKRKKILKERREIKKANIEIQCFSGNEITTEQWEIFYQFYASTFYKKWGEPRLTLNFFKSIGKALPDQTLLILANLDNETIAGAFAMCDNDTLYGRHWGCSRQLSYLHFELCYYQTIEYTIDKGLKKLDAGVQGEHKLARGFEPIAIPSAHWVKENDFHDAIANFLDRETVIMLEHIESLNNHLPYKFKV